VHQLTRADARRIAISAQLLERRRPTDLVDLVRHLTLLQLDPTAAIAPNADLVAWSRLGSAYSPRDLVAALDTRQLIELDARIRPAEDIALFRAEMAAWPGPEPLRDWQRTRLAWLEANDACRRDVLRRLAASGPLPSRDLPDTCAVPWRSSGWTNDRNVTKLLDLMAARGEVAIAGRAGKERLWDLAERVYPDAAPVPADQAHRILRERRLRSLGIARAKAPLVPVEPYDVGDAGEPAVVEGVKGRWRVDPAYLDAPFPGRIALLSPFDRLIHDRRRTTELFEFEYVLEMYKPAEQRRWGYFALPVLHGDRLVGKLDATADRAAGVLRVNALHADVELAADVRAAIEREVHELAGWLGLAVGSGSRSGT
jgi:uncharacterized protein YcaQ